MATTVINIKNAPKDWRRNPNYFYIGRGSRWGNQYSHLPYSKAKYKVNTLEESVEMFEKNQLPDLLPYIDEVVDKILVCFCKPHACHGDPIAKAANNRGSEND